MSSTHHPGDNLLAAWQEQLADAARQPLLARVLIERSREIQPRFAHFYEALRALPRPRRRSLQRRLGLTLSAVALMLALGSAPVPAATIEVDGLACTLADAITAANSDTASGGCLAGSGADTLVLSPGSTHTLTRVNNETFGPTGLPVIASEIVIEGNGARIERASSAPEFRILAVDSSGKLTLEQATVTGGNDASQFGSGGGLFSYGGDVTLTNSTISGNSARFGGGVRAFDATVTITGSTISGNSGAGVLFLTGYDGGSTTLAITNSTISGNITDATISGNSGGVVVRLFYGPNTTTIVDSTISGNVGAGVFSDVEGSAGTLTIVNSTISGNSARGVWAESSPRARLNVTIANSTLSGNSTSRSGAGVVGYAGYSSYLDLNITNSTISSNSAARNGGGVSTFPPGYGGDIEVEITDSTISGNSAGNAGGGVHVASSFDFADSDETVLTFNRSIISGNVALSGPEVVIDPSAPATITADNFNLFGFDGDAGVVGFSPGPSDIVPAPGVLLGDILDPILADNGGPTLTHALVEGSPAIDAIDATEPGCEGTDQRGVPRPQDGDVSGLPGCDVGAYELTAEAVPFARFDIAKARVKLRRRAGRDRFNLAGNFRLGAESDGVDVLNEEVVVTFNGFSETIPPGSFRRVRRGDDDEEEEGRAVRHFLFKGPPGGIRRLELTVGGVGGRFSIVAKRLDLDGLTLPATVAVGLRIGDDVAQTMIPLNRKGSFIRRGGENEQARN